jgi:adenylosuccinate synthase
MANRCVVGAQWGDEGKGKIVDVLSESAAIVARYSGGANAGHTVKIKNETFALHLIPTGVLHSHVTCVIGNGMVLDLPQLFTEIDGLKARGIDCEGRLKISTAAHVVMPYHKILEKSNEQRRGGGAIGTTMRGIGPAYADKVSRQGIRTACLLEPDELRRRVRINADDINRRTDGALDREGLTTDRIVKDMLEYAKRLRPMLIDASLYLDQAWRKGKAILLEGAQGALLDIDFGTYPYTTSSNNTVGGAFTGLGISPKVVESFIGISKAYATRVGNGPFPTELTGQTGDQLREAGNEFGTTTGRPRRCGWLDLVALKYAVRINGLDYLAITKLDVLDGFDEISVCTSYEFNGKTSDQMPADMCLLDRCRPVYATLPGWPAAPTRGITEFDALSGTVRNYIKYIEEFTGAKVGIISTGAGRHETIMRL